MKMFPQLNLQPKPLPTVGTVIRPRVAVQVSFVLLHVAQLTETLTTERTLEWFFSRVNPQVSSQIAVPTESLVTHAAFVRLLSAVNSAVRSEIARRCEQFSAEETLERLRSRMTEPVHLQILSVLVALAAVGAAELSTVHVHVTAQVAPSREAFAALIARMLHSAV